MTRRAHAALLLALLAGLAVGPGARAQMWVAPGYVHEAWTTAEGLPVDALSDVLQTRDGYLWVATFDGLARFDGVRFTVYNVGNTPGLPGNRIVSLRETRDGRLLIADQQGRVAIREGEDVRDLGLALAHEVPRLSAVYEDAAGRLWIGTTEGLVVVDAEGMRPFTPSPPGPEVLTVHETGGTLWVGGASGLYRYDGRRWQPVRTGTGASLTQIEALYGDEWEPGTLWVGALEGLYRYRSGRLEAVAPGATTRVQAVTQDREGTLLGWDNRGAASSGSEISLS